MARQLSARLASGLGKRSRSDGLRDPADADEVQGAAVVRPAGCSIIVGMIAACNRSNHDEFAWDAIGAW
jgi:hypothetical protein